MFKYPINTEVKITDAGKIYPYYPAFYERNRTPNTHYYREGYSSAFLHEVVEGLTGVIVAREKYYEKGEILYLINVDGMAESFIIEEQGLDLIEPPFKFSTGSKVKIIFPAKRYTSYKELYERNKTTQTYKFAESNGLYTDARLKGLEGTIVARALHPTDDSRVYIINVDTLQEAFLLQEEGIALVPQHEITIKSDKYISFGKCIADSQILMVVSQGNMEVIDFQENKPFNPPPLFINNKELKVGSKFILKPWKDNPEYNNGINQEEWDSLYSLPLLVKAIVYPNFVRTHCNLFNIDAIDRIIYEF